VGVVTTTTPGNESFGIEGLTPEDRTFAGSKFSDVRDAIFANPYQKVWGSPGEPALERFPVTLGSVLRGLFALGKSWLFLDAARRSVASHADLRWGPNRRGYRRLLHSNGIGLVGTWEITEETPYTGYFRQGSRGLVIARYSTCCTETRQGHTRSLALAGRIYPTVDPHESASLPTASFITQQDIGGENSRSINEAILRNAPNTTLLRRGSGVPILLTTAIVLRIADKQPTMRQLYQIAELGKPEHEATRAPEFMQLTVAPEQPVIPGDALDFRDEILAQIYDPGDPAPKRTLKLLIETSDQGTSHFMGQRHNITAWRRIGTMTFTEAVTSFNVDRVLHFNHPPWREDRNDPGSANVT